MTDTVMGEIYALGQQALAQGQDRFQVQVFPFRMTEENMRKHANSPWLGFWTNLKEAYDAFERTRIPPKVATCGGRYVVSEGVLGSERNLGSPPEAPLSMCEETRIEPTPLSARAATPADTKADTKAVTKAVTKADRRQASRRAHRHHAGRHSRRRAHLAGHDVERGHRVARRTGHARHRHAPTRAGRDRAAHHMLRSVDSGAPRFRTRVTHEPS
jgi:hypothetical protein